METLTDERDQQAVQTMVCIFMKQQRLPVEELAQTNFEEWMEHRGPTEDQLAMQIEWSLLVSIAIGEVKEEVKMLLSDAAKWWTIPSLESCDVAMNMEAEAVKIMARMLLLHQTIGHLQ